MRSAHGSLPAAQGACDLEAEGEQGPATSCCRGCLHPARTCSCPGLVLPAGSQHPFAGGSEPHSPTAALKVWGP